MEKLTEEKAWMVTVPRVNADFIAAEDFDECAVTTYAKNGEAKPCQVHSTLRAGEHVSPTFSLLRAQRSPKYPGL